MKMIGLEGVGCLRLGFVVDDIVADPAAGFRLFAALAELGRQHSPLPAPKLALVQATAWGTHLRAGSGRRLSVRHDVDHCIRHDVIERLGCSSEGAEVDLLSDTSSVKLGLHISDACDDLALRLDELIGEGIDGVLSRHGEPSKCVSE